MQRRGSGIVGDGSLGRQIDVRVRSDSAGRPRWGHPHPRHRPRILDLALLARSVRAHSRVALMVARLLVVLYIAGSFD